MMEEGRIKHPHRCHRMSHAWYWLARTKMTGQLCRVRGRNHERSVMDARLNCGGNRTTVPWIKVSWDRGIRLELLVMYQYYGVLWATKRLSSESYRTRLVLELSSKLLLEYVCPIEGEKRSKLCNSQLNRI